jgi:hypothetical protein
VRCVHDFTVPCLIDNLAPMPGDMILFPSWLEHSVSAFRQPGERISIAFSAKLIRASPE